jgi:hypothetical protein
VSEGTKTRQAGDEHAAVDDSGELERADWLRAAARQGGCLRAGSWRCRTKQSSSQGATGMKTAESN